MIYWLMIILGTIILSTSVSNPLYTLLIGKKLKINYAYNFLIKFFLFLLGVTIIFFGLFVESIG
jgi:hypothetical protein